MNEKLTFYPKDELNRIYDELDELSDDIYSVSSTLFENSEEDISMEIESIGNLVYKAQKELRKLMRKEADND